MADLLRAGTAKVEGRQEAVTTLLTSLEPFEFWFEIITANPPKP